MLLTPRRASVGVNTQQQSNGTTPQHQPNGMDYGRQSNMINPQNQQNGVISTTRHTPNGVNSQHEREDANLQRLESQSAPPDLARMTLRPAPIMEDDYPLTAIRVPVGIGENPHYVRLEIRDCPVPGCRCRFPDLRRFLGDHELWELDYQVFRALWEPPGMDSLHGTYILFTITSSTVDNRPRLQRNDHFLARLKGDVFILKVKESIDERVAFTDPLGHPAITRPHQSGVHDARYEHIVRDFFGSDLFTEMTLTATPAYSRLTNPATTQFAIPVGFWRAFVQGRLRTTDYQVPPVTPATSLIIARFWPLHRGALPPYMIPGVPV